MIIARLKLNPFLFLVTSIVLFSTGCTAHYPVNQQISEVNFDTGYRNIEPKINDRSDSLFVGLAFSGGGTRAAAFAYGVLESLRDINNEIKRLPTSFSLDGNSVDDLIQAAKLILQESPQLQKFLNELQ